MLSLTSASNEDLQWWLTNTTAPMGAPVCPSEPSIAVHSDASNQGWGVVLNGQSQTGGVWSPEEATHHINYLELLAAFLAIKAFGKTWQNITVLLRLDNVTAVSYINQKGGTVSRALCELAISIWTWCTERNITIEAEHLPGQLNVQADQESRTIRDRCDWKLKQQVFHQIQTAMGPLEVDLFASRLTKQLPRFYSWRPDPEAEATDVGLGNMSGICQPPMVPDSSLPCQSEETNSKDSTNNTLVENPIVSIRPSGGLSSKDTSATGPGINATGARISDATGNTPVDRLAYLRQSYSSRGISAQASDLMLRSWRDKTNSNYGSSFSRWASWCQQRNRDPLAGPIEGVVNFLATLYSEGYQYQSLNAYRSAISCTHQYVDGVSVGSHPTVTRLLQGVFNSRPPQPRYTTFWDVGVVIQHIKGLGANKDLSLK